MRPHLSTRPTALPGNKWVTDGARTREFRSHNPPNPVARCCSMLQNRLIQAYSHCSWLPDVSACCVPSGVRSGVNIGLVHWRHDLPMPTFPSSEQSRCDLLEVRFAAQAAPCAPRDQKLADSMQDRLRSIHTSSLPTAQVC
jgi:hypothetical protein